MLDVTRHLIFLPILLMLLAVGCSRPPQYQAQGYIEGRYTYMATSVSGVLRKINVDRGARIKEGQVLFILEEQPESDAYAAALENLKQTIAAREAISANLTYAKLTYERYKILVPKNAIPQSSLDDARSNYNALLAQFSQASANIASSSATLAQARWTKNQKLISSPVDGVVFDTYYRLGEYTQANLPILSLLAPSNIKAIFYISETALSAVKLGDKVLVECDGCDKAYSGHISFISPTAEYTPPVIFSEATNEKLIFRIEAEFTPENAFHLHPGQPVTVKYHLHD